MNTYVGSKWLPTFMAAIVVASPSAAEPSLQPAGEMKQPVAVTSMAYSDDGQRLLTAGLDGIVYNWVLKERKAKAFSLHDGDIGVVAYMPDNRFAVSTGVDGKVLLFSTDTGKIVRKWQMPTWCLGLAVIDREQIAVGCADQKIRRIFVNRSAIASETAVKGDPQYSYIGAIIVSNDRSHMLSLDPANFFDLGTNKQISAARLNAHNARFSHDGKHILAGSFGAGAAIIELDGYKTVAQLRTYLEDDAFTVNGTVKAQHNMPIYGVAWSPDGRFAATGGLDKLVRIWNVEQLEKPVEIARFKAHDTAISEIIWKDQASLISTDMEGKIKLWTFDEKGSAQGWK